MDKLLHHARLMGAPIGSFPTPDPCPAITAAHDRATAALNKHAARELLITASHLAMTGPDHPVFPHLMDGVAKLTARIEKGAR